MRRTISRAARSSSPRRCASSASPCRPAATPPPPAAGPSFVAMCCGSPPLRRRCGASLVVCACAYTAHAPRTGGVGRSASSSVNHDQLSLNLGGRRCCCTLVARTLLLLGLPLIRAMDLSLWTSFPRLLVFYAVLLLLVFPVLSLFDRVLYRSKRTVSKRAA